MKLVSIDLETTGLDPETCQIIEFCAILNDPGLEVSECPRFHCYVTHHNYRGEPYAFSMHTKILRRIAEREEGYSYVPADDVVKRFRHFLRQRNCGKFVATGKNFAAFDLPFLKRLQGWVNVSVHHRVIDPGNLYWDFDYDGWELPDTATCMKRAGLEPQVTHEAVDDAEVVLELVRRKL